MRKNVRSTYNKAQNIRILKLNEKINNIFPPKKKESVKEKSGSSDAENIKEKWIARVEAIDIFCSFASIVKGGNALSESVHRRVCISTFR